MTKQTAFRIFLFGTLSSALLFLGLTVDTHRQVAALSHADQLSPQVVAGKQAFERYNCNDCHTILGFGGYYAPDLTRAIKRLGPEGLRYRIKSPEKAFAGSWRKMPQLKVNDQELDDMVAFFTWVGGIDNNDWPPQDSAKRRLIATAGLSPGAALFNSKGCMGCHSLNGAGGDTGPALDGVGRRYSTEQLEHLIKNPRSVNPDAEMPPQDQLSSSELDELAHFLSTLK